MKLEAMKRKAGRPLEENRGQIVHNYSEQKSRFGLHRVRRSGSGRGDERGALHV